MALSQRLEFRQSQALVMTPQLMQAIKLLQLSNLDLVAYVEGELERNPLLERAEPDSTPLPDGAEADGVADTSTSDAADGDWMAQDLETSRGAIEDRLDTSLENIYPDEPGGAARQENPDPLPAPADWSGAGSGGREDGDYNLEAFVSAETTLADHLTGQFMLAVSDPVQRMIGHYLIDLVDESGYLVGDLDQAAERLGTSRAEVDNVLAVLQTFEPTGICARTLMECLALQLREKNRFDPAMAALVGHLDLLARRDMAALRKVCGVDDEDLRDMIAEIRQLDPRPGLAFASASVQPIVPDVFVRPLPDGSWQVELNTDTLPKVLVNQTYHTKVAKTARSTEDKTYLADCLQTATWLVRALDQRARTILKVSTEIVRQQDGFFSLGVEHLRPLNLKTVADAIGMHESTVSRVTANKYMATTRGIFELKYFFTSAIASADGGEAHSAEAVRHRIRQLIDAEAADNILSDDTIVEKLRGAGIDIARRTVAKYREAMRIASSVQRRREKQAAAAGGGRSDHVAPV